MSENQHYNAQIYNANSEKNTFPHSSTNYNLERPRPLSTLYPHHSLSNGVTNKQISRHLYGKGTKRNAGDISLNPKSITFETDPPKDRIFNGWELTPHEFPWMVKLKVRC